MSPPASVRGRPRAPRAQPLSQVDWVAASSAARRLQEELRGVLESLPADERGASALARLLGMDRATCQRVVQAATEAAPDARLLARMPGIRGLEAFLDAVAAHGEAPQDRLVQARAAVEQAAAVFAALGGSQARFAARLAASAPAGAPLEDGVLEEQRRALFDAAAMLTGRSTGIAVTVFAYRPAPGDPGRIESFGISGLIGHEARPDAVPLVFQWGSRGTQDEARRPFGSLDATPAKGRSASTVLEGFSSKPLPLVTSTGPDGSLSQAVDAQAASRGPVDLVIATRPRGGAPHPATESPPVQESWALQHFPARHLIFDAWLHRSLAVGCLPSCDVHLWRPGFETQAHQRWMTRFPRAPRLSVLGVGLGDAGSRAWPRHAEMLAHAFEQAGWDASEFAGYRCEESHPIWRAGYRIALDFGASA